MYDLGIPARLSHAKEKPPPFNESPCPSEEHQNSSLSIGIVTIPWVSQQNVPLQSHPATASSLHFASAGVASSESSSPLPLFPLMVLEKRDRAVGFLLFVLRNVSPRHSLASLYHSTHCLLICLCLKPASFELAGLRIASEGEIYVPEELLCSAIFLSNACFC